MNAGYAVSCESWPRPVQLSGACGVLCGEVMQLAFELGDAVVEVLGRVIWPGSTTISWTPGNSGASHVAPASLVCVRVPERVVQLTVGGAPSQTGSPA